MASVSLHFDNTHVVRSPFVLMCRIEYMCPLKQGVSKKPGNKAGSFARVAPVSGFVRLANVPDLGCAASVHCEPFIRIIFSSCHLLLPSSPRLLQQIKLHCEFGRWRVPVALKE